MELEQSLTQQGKPIAYMSRVLGALNPNWSTYAKELLAVVIAIQTWRPYLMGHKFYIQTEHNSLKHLLDQRITTPKQQKWVSKLFGYDYEIIYRLEKENKAADALSRQVIGATLDTSFVGKHQIWDDIKTETE